jgi:hypothetical protein
MTANEEVFKTNTTLVSYSYFLFYHIQHRVIKLDQSDFNLISEKQQQKV